MAKNDDGGLMHVEIDGVNITGSINIPNTGGWQTWETVTIKNLNLIAGEKVVRVVFDSQYINFNYMEFRDLVTSLNYKTDNNYHVYPNPFGNNGFKITSSTSTSYQVFDIYGRIILKGKTIQDNHLGLNLPSGVYLLKVNDEKGTQTIQLIKD